MSPPNGGTDRVIVHVILELLLASDAMASTSDPVIVPSVALDTGVVSVNPLLVILGTVAGKLSTLKPIKFPVPLHVNVTVELRDTLTDDGG
jgi:hypothetical protein